MSRIKTCFDSLAKTNSTALVSYITAGDPHPELTVTLMHALVKAGTDIIELGVPFSDPMADGPVIQAACERALSHNTSLHQVLEMVGQFRKHDDATPIVLMGYQNPIEVIGVEKFAASAQQHQVDGILTVDLPIEQAKQILQVYNDQQLDSIFLIAPTTNEKRIKAICDNSSGFVYYVSLKGVTGAGHLQLEDVQEKVAQIKKLSSLPVGVGFGIKDAESARKISSIADAVVVGSAIIRQIEDNISDEAKMLKNINNLLSSMRSAMDNVENTKDVA